MAEGRAASCSDGSSLISGSPVGLADEFFPFISGRFRDLLGIGVWEVIRTRGKGEAYRFPEDGVPPYPRRWK